MNQHNQRPPLYYGVQSTRGLYSNSKTFFGLIQIPIIMSPINKLTIDNVTDVRNDIHNRPYRLIYTPETWTVKSISVMMNLCLNYLSQVLLST